ncbi:hypothetical protein FAUST_7818 [Fusarium austroamericanum]|uniref:Uncharacterized protein n=1 Tax=Fusarium austroamericanum TaxID=282268 RepID=A0AAN5Z792_FUSAU|nr:hypothetical protein FAUST_7818 [Fusarium austroamericanum]
MRLRPPPMSSPEMGGFIMRYIDVLIDNKHRALCYTEGDKGTQKLLIRTARQRTARQRTARRGHSSPEDGSDAAAEGPRNVQQQLSFLVNNLIENCSVDPTINAKKSKV